MDLPREARSGKLSSSYMEPSFGFHEVGFAYPGQETLKALENIDLTIHAGERVAILGGIGSG